MESADPLKRKAEDESDYAKRAKVDTSNEHQTRWANMTVEERARQEAACKAYRARQKASKISKHEKNYNYKH
jgi:uncharacterized protein (DUF2252 family)